jgi:glycerol-3-phosphate dehydrogenase
MLQQLKGVDVWDIVVIGGGATGLGAAVDAASRGYKTLLVEQYDFAKGTSSRATKLVHGGVRYLAQGNIKLVMEALRERGYLLKNAPHLTTSLPFVIPVYSLWEKFYYGFGLMLYDVLSGTLSIGKTKVLNKKQATQYLPGIDASKLAGGILYYDGQFDDARLATELAKTAVQHGAAVVNYCKVTSLLKKGGAVSGITIHDVIGNQHYTINAKAVINATGVFTNAILNMDEPGQQNLVAPSQGVHLVVDKKFFPGSHALMIPKTDDGRVLFAVPWHNKVVLGTTDTPVEQIVVEPKPLEEEINFILHHANRYLEATIERADVTSMFAGLRPLVKQKHAKKTSVLSRDHTILISTSKMVTVTGGKWTTYRRMAEDAVNHAAEVTGLPQKACITKTLPLGKQVSDGEALVHGAVTISEESVRYFVEEEMAITVEDVLARRTRLLFLNATEALAQARPVAVIMAGLLGHDEGWINQQVAAFTALASQYILV